MALKLKKKKKREREQQRQNRLRRAFLLEPDLRNQLKKRGLWLHSHFDSDGESVTWRICSENGDRGAWLVVRPCELTWSCPKTKERGTYQSPGHVFTLVRERFRHWRAQ